MAWLKPFGKKTPARGGAAALENDAAMERDPFAEETPEERKMRSRKKRTSDTVAGVLTWIVWAFIFLYSLTLIFLYGWILMTAFKTQFAWLENSFGWPAEWTFDNFALAFREMKVLVFSGNEQKDVFLEVLLLNSFIYLVGCGLVATIAPCIMAYATSKFNFAFNKVIDGIVIVTMILPIIGALPSEIAMAKTLGFYGTFWGMFFMKFTFLGANYLYFKSAFRGVPDDYAEAARIDGASQFRVMLQIMMPMVSNIFFLILLLQMIGFWGDWQTPMIYLPEYPTVAYSLYNIQFSTEPPLNSKPVQMAACVLASLPTLVVFVLFKNKIMGGLAFGGLKG